MYWAPSYRNERPPGRESPSLRLGESAIHEQFSSRDVDFAVLLSTWVPMRPSGRRLVICGVRSFGLKQHRTSQGTMMRKDRSVSKHRDEGAFMTKGEQTRRKIVEAAAPIFNQSGFEGSSLNDL